MPLDEILLGHIIDDYSPAFEETIEQKNINVITYRSMDYNTLLHYAALYNAKKITTFLLKQDEDCQLLLAKNHFELSALEIAVLKGYFKLTKLLIQAYKDGEISFGKQTSIGKDNILFKAVLSESLKIIKLLVSHGFSLVELNDDRENLFFYAIRRARILSVEYLLASYPQHFTLKDRNRQGLTPLQLAAKLTYEDDKIHQFPHFAMFCALLVKHQDLQDDELQELKIVIKTELELSLLKDAVKQNEIIQNLILEFSIEDEGIIEKLKQSKDYQAIQEHLQNNRTKTKIKEAMPKIIEKHVESHDLKPGKSSITSRRNLESIEQLKECLASNEHFFDDLIIPSKFGSDEDKKVLGRLEKRQKTMEEEYRVQYRQLSKKFKSLKKRGEDNVQELEEKLIALKKQQDLFNRHLLPLQKFEDRQKNVQALIGDDPRIKIFYDTIRIELRRFFSAMTVINSGFVGIKKDNSRLTNLTSGVAALATIVKKAIKKFPCLGPSLEGFVDLLDDIITYLGVAEKIIEGLDKAIKFLEKKLRDCESKEVEEVIYIIKKVWSTTREIITGCPDIQISYFDYFTASNVEQDILISDIAILMAWEYGELITSCIDVQNVKQSKKLAECAIKRLTSALLIIPPISHRSFFIGQCLHLVSDHQMTYFFGLLNDNTDISKTDEQEKYLIFFSKTKKITEQDIFAGTGLQLFEPIMKEKSYHVKHFSRNGLEPSLGYRRMIKSLDRTIKILHRKPLLDEQESVRVGEYFFIRKKEEKFYLGFYHAYEKEYKENLINRECHKELYAFLSKKSENTFLGPASPVSQSIFNLAAQWGSSGSHLFSRALESDDYHSRNERNYIEGEIQRVKVIAMCEDILNGSNTRENMIAYMPHNKNNENIQSEIEKDIEMKKELKRQKEELQQQHGIIKQMKNTMDEMQAEMIKLKEMIMPTSTKETTALEKEEIKKNSNFMKDTVSSSNKRITSKRQSTFF